METPLKDVVINLPSEYRDALAEVISVGIQKAKLPPKVKHELTAWWTAEREFMQGD